MAAMCETSCQRPRAISPSCRTTGFGAGFELVCLVSGRFVVACTGLGTDLEQTNGLREGFFESRTEILSSFIEEAKTRLSESECSVWEHGTLCDKIVWNQVHGQHFTSEELRNCYRHFKSRSSASAFSLLLTALGSSFPFLHSTCALTGEGLDLSRCARPSMPPALRRESTKMLQSFD